MTVWLCVLLAVLALAPCGASAQSGASSDAPSASSFAEVGRFYMRSFAPEDYGGRTDGGMGPKTSFSSGLAVHDTFYVTESSGELLYMHQDTLRLAPGGAAFAGKRIYELVPHGVDAYLVVTRRNGLMRCRVGVPEQEACAPYNPGLTDLLV